MHADTRRVNHACVYILNYVYVGRAPCAVVHERRGEARRAPQWNIAFSALRKHIFHCTHFRSRSQCTQTSKVCERVPLTILIICVRMCKHGHHMMMMLTTTMAMMAVRSPDSWVVCCVGVEVGVYFGAL